MDIKRKLKEILLLEGEEQEQEMKPRKGKKKATWKIVLGILVICSVISIAAFSLNLLYDYFGTLSPKKYYAKDLFTTIKMDIDYKEQNVAAYGVDRRVLKKNGFPVMYYGIEDFDLDEFKGIGGRYIFAAEPITADFVSELTLEGVYTDDFYTIYLYRTNHRYVEKTWSTLSWEERKQLTLDADTAAMQEMSEELMGYFTKDAEPVHQERVFDLIDELWTSYCFFTDCSTICSICTDADIYDEEALEAYYSALDRNDEAYDLLAAPFSISEDSVYWDSILEHYGQRAEILPYYTCDDDDIDDDAADDDATDDAADGYEREKRRKELVLKMFQLNAQEYTFTYNGREWTSSELEENEWNLDEDSYLDIYCGLEKERATACFPVYCELMEMHREDAKAAGYSSYADYAFEELFGRDYTVKDVKKLIKLAKQYAGTAADVKKRFGELGDHDPGNVLQNEDTDYEKLLPLIEAINPELGDSLSHLLECGLCDLAMTESKRENIAYTIAFDSYGDAFVFSSPLEKTRNLRDLIHEYGHYNFDVHARSGFGFSGCSIDCQEIYSQGLEILGASKSGDFFGEEAGAYIELEALENLLISIVIESLSDTEFEIYEFEHPEASMEELEAAYHTIQAEYGLASEDLRYDRQYLWLADDHFYESPMYMISYAVSALPALELYAISLEDYELACEKYLTLTMIEGGYSFQQQLEIAGLPNIFDTKAMKTTLDKSFRQFFLLAAELDGSTGALSEENALLFDAEDRLPEAG